ncbi:MAG: hypothetical protein Fur0012_13210 [Elusimicrobiota bacterium]
MSVSQRGQKGKVFEISFTGYNSAPKGSKSSINYSQGLKSKISDAVSDIPQSPQESSGHDSYDSGANSALPRSGQEGVYSLAEGPKIKGELLVKYPLTARRLKKNGFVKVGITIDENGKMISFSILESSGEEFSKSVEQALRNAAFEPAFVNGSRVKSYGVLPVRFEIKD